MKPNTSHVNETYFLSPIYREKIIDRITYLDEKDLFPRWLKENSFTRKVEISSGFYCESADLLGENNCLCRIYYPKVMINREFAEVDSVDKDGKSCREKFGFFIYQYLVKILSQPFSREIPKILLNALEEFNYQKKQKDCKEISDILKSLYYL